MGLDQEKTRSPSTALHHLKEERKISSCSVRKDKNSGKRKCPFRD